MATFRATVNPIKAGGLNLCTAGGGSVRCPPPLEKGLNEWV